MTTRLIKTTTFFNENRFCCVFTDASEHRFLWNWIPADLLAWVYVFWCSLAADFIITLFTCRWPQNLAEQISLWRPKLPGGCKLCVCAHWPLLKRATAGLLLNVISRGLHMPLLCSCSLHSGGRTMLNEVWTWYSHIVYCAQNLTKIKKNNKKITTENPHTRRVGGVQHPQGCTHVLFFHFVSVLSRLAKNYD